jgi:hypothetical protein
VVSMKLCSLLILSTVLCWAASGAAAQVFDPAKVGAPLSGALAELYLPAGAAPVGAVVVLHGCDGIEPHYRQWAQRLADWRYAALLIDSFGPRGGHPTALRRRVLGPGAVRGFLLPAHAGYEVGGAPDVDLGYHGNRLHVLDS